MTNPMYCPMSFGQRVIVHLDNCDHTEFDFTKPKECTPDCAWAVKTNKYYGCAVALIPGVVMDQVNLRIIKEDTNDE